MSRLFNGSLLVPLTILAAGFGTMVQARPTLSGTEHILNSPSDRFTVHWTDSGADSTSQAYASSIAKAADTSWAVECDQLGFYVPPPDQGEGGSNRYDIYLLSLSGTVTGYMSFAGEYKPPDSTHSATASHIVMSTQLESPQRINCTTANLFALAVGAAYDYNEPTVLTSCFAAWMEDQTFPDANLYLEYLQLPDPLENPWCQFGTLGSSDFPWMRMVSTKWGTQSVRRIWELCAVQPGASSQEALTGMLAEMGCTFEEFIMEYGAWRWFTAGNWFPECAMYDADAALWLPGPAVLPAHQVSSLPWQGEHVPGYEPEEAGLNWISVDLSGYADQWIQFDFDGADNIPWRIGVILYDSSGEIYTDRHQCQEPDGTCTFSVYTADREHGVFYPLPMDQGSGDNTYAFTLTAQGTGIGNQDPAEPYMILSPNPAETSVRLTATHQGNTRLTVFDTAGRMIIQEELEPGSEVLNVSEIPPGMYLIHAESEGTTAVSRLVVVH